MHPFAYSAFLLCSVPVPISNELAKMLLLLVLVLIPRWTLGSLFLLNTKIWKWIDEFCWSLIFFPWFRRCGWSTAIDHLSLFSNYTPRLFYTPSETMSPSLSGSDRVGNKLKVFIFTPADPFAIYFCQQQMSLVVFATRICVLRP